MKVNQVNQVRLVAEVGGCVAWLAADGPDDLLVRTVGHLLSHSSLSQLSEKNEKKTIKK